MTTLMYSKMIKENVFQNFINPFSISILPSDFSFAQEPIEKKIQHVFIRILKLLPNDESLQILCIG